MRLGSYEEVLKWQDTLAQYQDEVESEELKKALVLAVDANYIRLVLEGERGPIVLTRCMYKE